MTSVATTTEVSREVEVVQRRRQWPRWVQPIARIPAVPVTAIIGVVLVAAGLWLPWLGMPLETEKRATGLRLVFAAAPTRSWATYGAAVAVCLTVAVAALVRTRGRGNALLALAGAGALLLPLL